MSSGQTAPALRYFNFSHRIRFPTLEGNVVVLICLGALGGLVSAQTQTPHIIVYDVLRGISILSLPTLVADILVWLSLFRKDPVVTLRRLFSLSAVSLALWNFTIVFSRVLSPGELSAGIPFSLAVVASMPIRIVTLDSLSSRGSLSPVGALMQPIALMAQSLFAGWLSLSQFGVAVVASVVIGLSMNWTMTFFLERRGEHAIGKSPVGLFRAYLIGWLAGDDEPLEKFFESLAAEKEIRCTLFCFKTLGIQGRVKSMIAVSDFHPGPFRNLGSSSLPSKIQRHLTEATGAVVMVPHGISEHDKNIVSQRECAKIIRAFEGLARQNSFDKSGTRMVRTSTGRASATSQRLGQGILVTLSARNVGMEDIPSWVERELNMALPSQATLALVDAHNSIIPKAETVHQAQELTSCARQAVETVLTAPLGPLQVGASWNRITTHGAKSGLGPGGISTMVLQTSEQRVAYSTIDGNNMICGLSEKIAARLSALGIDDCEILTTDTHVVNGIVPAPLGYHPLGDAIPPKLIIEWVEDSAKDAMRNLEECEVSAGRTTVNAMTFGAQNIDSMLTYIRRSGPFVLSFIVLGTVALVFLSSVLIRVLS